MQAESLIHSTEAHEAVCDFDQKFNKLPCYFRRSAIGAFLRRDLFRHSVFQLHRPDLYVRVLCASAVFQ